MRVAIFGTGYVGLVTGTCLAEVGHDVICVDIDPAKVDGLNQGIVPIYEPGLSPMVKANHAAGRLRFTTDAASAIAHGDVLFIAVGRRPMRMAAPTCSTCWRWQGRSAATSGARARW